MSLTIKTYLSLQLTLVQDRDELVERCKNGDAKGYKELYDQYARSMCNTCLRILNNATEAEDVLQESFIETFRTCNHSNTAPALEDG